VNDATQTQSPPGPFWRGRDLAAERVRRGLLQREVAARLGLPARRVAAIEASWRPTSAIVARYLDAIEL